MKTILTLFLLLPAVWAFPGEDSKSTTADTVTYAVDPVHSGAVFRVRRNVANFYGRIDGIRGTIELDTETPINSSVELRIDPATIHTGQEKRDNHLRSPDFFDTEQFEEIVFRSTELTAGEAPNTYLVEGELEMLGVTKTITGTVTMTGTGEGLRGEQEAGFDVTLVIDRTQFGMKYGTGLISDEVTIMIGINAQKR